MNEPDVLEAFTAIQLSLHRARLTYDLDNSDEAKKVTAYELLKISFRALYAAERVAGKAFVDEFESKLLAEVEKEKSEKPF